MADLIPIIYRDFYDVPRMFIVNDDGISYLFDAPFDDTQDEYSDFYTVSILPPLDAVELTGSWTSLQDRAIGYLGKVPVSTVQFDDTRRKAIEQDSLHSIIVGQQSAISDSLTLDGRPLDLDVVKAASFSEGWIEMVEFVLLPDGGKRLTTELNAEKGGEEPVIRKKSGHLRRLESVA